MKKILLAILILAMAFPAYGRRTEKGDKTIDPRESGWIRDSRTGVISPLVPSDKVVFGDYSSYGTGSSVVETDPIAMPVLANVSSQLNTLESTFTNFTGNVDAKTLNGLPATSFTLLSTFSAYTSTAGKSHAAYLSYEEVEGFFETYSTADVYYKWQNNITDSASFGNMSASTSDGSITILPGGDGLYQISRNTGIHGQPEVGYSFAIFNNESALSESHTSPGVPSESFPFFTNLSSYGGDAIYGVNSTIPFLLHPDKDQIDIIEGGTGNGANQWCFEYEMHFEVSHIPHFLSLGNSQYTGGAGHFADLLAFDNWSSEWDDMRIATGDIINAGAQADYKNENIAFSFPNDGNEVKYLLDGVVKIKLRHNGSVVCSSGHTMWLDYASVTDKLGARSDSVYIIRELVAGDKITVREKPDAADKFFHRHKTILNISRIGDLDT